jgi:hypothetical protein
LRHDNHQLEPFRGLAAIRVHDRVLLPLAEQNDGGRSLADSALRPDGSKSAEWRARDRAVCP